jgi:DNA-binding NarL/FixJ family response regulator
LPAAHGSAVPGYVEGVHEPFGLHRPVRVTLAHECDLVTRGVTEMLAPYACRVVLAPADADGTPADDVDITLHDFLDGPYTETEPFRPVRGVRSGRLVAYTWQPRPDLVARALEAGVAGVLSKSLPAAGLVAALEAVHRGEVVVEYGARPPRPSADDATGLLTPREREIVALITRGLDNVSISREVSLSINSVKSHIRSAYRKMGVSSRSQAVLWGVRHGYLPELPRVPEVEVPRDALPV